MAKTRKPFRQLSPGVQQRYRRQAAKEGISVRQLRARGVAAARGHKEESVEKKERARRIRQQYNVSVKQYTVLRKLQREAAEHAKTLLDATPTRKPANYDRVRENINAQSIAGLRGLLAIKTGAEWRDLASLTYATLIEAHPEFANTSESVPLWYR